MAARNVRFVSYLMMHLIIGVCTWDANELSMYDLVEEVGVNFYQLFSIEKSASIQEVKRAYRRLSLEWHPDRNSDIKAADQFRKIASVYEILKNDELRMKYDNVLINGLPNWKQPIFYYRRARKLSWFEAMFILLLISSLGHYSMLWGIYMERYLTLTSNRSKLKKKDIRQMRKTGNFEAEDTYYAEIAEKLSDVLPSWRKSLPIVIILFLINTAVASSASISNCISEFWRNEPEEIEEESTRYQSVSSAQPQFDFAMALDIKPVLKYDFIAKDESNEANSPEDVSSKDASLWTCAEMAQLVKLCTEKYPVGTADRWERMAKILNRPSSQIAIMAAKLKHFKGGDHIDLLRDLQSSSVTMKAASRTKLNAPELTTENPSSFDINSGSGTKSDDTDWSQNEQRLFEKAIQQFSKELSDRWDKISACVPNKTKQECIERFKYLSKMVRQRRLQNQNGQ